MDYYLPFLAWESAILFVSSYSIVSLNPQTQNFTAYCLKI